MTLFDMTLAIAIAHSAGNKAKTTKRDGTIVIVQQQLSFGDDWLHVWIITGDDVREGNMKNAEKLLSIYDVHPDMPIWNAL